MRFIQARWYTPANRTKGDIDWLVVHSTEGSELPSSAWNLGIYFSGAARKGSSHVGIDPTETVRYVLDKDVAYGAANANRRGLHAELCGRASQTREQWLDWFSVGEIEQCAKQFAIWCREYDVPAVFVDAEGLRRGERGITTHAEVQKAWPSTGHTDPGPNFPMDELLRQLHYHLIPDPGYVESDPVNDRTRTVEITPNAFGLGQCTVPFGAPLVALKGLVLNGPNPDVDGWWTEDLNVRVRGQLHGDSVIVTVTGATRPVTVHVTAAV